MWSKNSVINITLQGDILSRDAHLILCQCRESPLTSVVPFFPRASDSFIAYITNYIFITSVSLNFRYSLYQVKRVDILHGTLIATLCIMCHCWIKTIDLSVSLWKGLSSNTFYWHFSRFVCITYMTGCYRHHLKLF